MTFIGDIQLDIRGNTIVSNGEIGSTDTNLEFVIRSLRYGPEAFELNPEIGFGLDRYIGEKNDEALYQKMVIELNDYFELYGLVVDVHISSVDINVINLEVELLHEDTIIVVGFNIESGLLTFEDGVPIEEETILERMSHSKYLNRL